MCGGSFYPALSQPESKFYEMPLFNEALALSTILHIKFITRCTNNLTVKTALSLPVTLKSHRLYEFSSDKKPEHFCINLKD